MSFRLSVCLQIVQPGLPTNGDLVVCHTSYRVKKTKQKSCTLPASLVTSPVHFPTESSFPGYWLSGMPFFLCSLSESSLALLYVSQCIPTFLPIQDFNRCLAKGSFLTSWIIIKCPALATLYSFTKYVFGSYSQRSLERIPIWTMNSVLYYFRSSS